MKRVLVIDIGGTHVKLMLSRSEKREFDSSPGLAPRPAISQIKKSVGDWRYGAVAIGFPARVQNGRIIQDPKNLGSGWIGFDFKKALRKPVRVANDAALQALGSYEGGRMLFLGLGTGLGSALVWPGHVLSLELSELPYVNSASLETQLGKEELKRLGKKDCASEVIDVVTQLKSAFVADYVVLGGGNAKLLDELPESVELGHNRNAYLGGTRLWQVNPVTRRKKWNIL